MPSTFLATGSPTDAAHQAFGSVIKTLLSGAANWTSVSVGNSVPVTSSPTAQPVTMSSSSAYTQQLRTKSHNYDLFKPQLRSYFMHTAVVTNINIYYTVTLYVERGGFTNQSTAYTYLTDTLNAFVGVNLQQCTNNLQTAYTSTTPSYTGITCTNNINIGSYSTTIIHTTFAPTLSTYDRLSGLAAADLNAIISVCAIVGVFIIVVTIYFWWTGRCTCGQICHYLYNIFTCCGCLVMMLRCSCRNFWKIFCCIFCCQSLKSNKGDGDSDEGSEADLRQPNGGKAGKVDNKNNSKYKKDESDEEDDEDDDDEDDDDDEGHKKNKGGFFGSVFSFGGGRRKKVDDDDDDDDEEESDEEEEEEKPRGKRK